MVRPAQINTVNLGNVFAGIEQTRGARLRNQMASFQLDQARQQAETQARVRQIKMQFDNAGEIAAELGRQGMFEQRDQFIQKQRQGFQAAQQLLGSMADMVTDEASYESIRAEAIAKGWVLPEDMPTRYSPTFFKREQAKLRGKMSTFLQEAGVDERGRRQVRQITQGQTGEIVAESPEFEPIEERRLREQRRQFNVRAREARRTREAKGFQAKAQKSGLKAADANAIRKVVVGAFEGLYNLQTGAFQGLKKPEDRKVVVRVSADAEKRFLDGRAASHAEAARQALSAAGITDVGGTVPERGALVGPPTDPNNPLGLRR